MSDFVTTGAAAQRLGVTARQVQRLVDAGVLRSLERGVLDGASVERHLATRGDAHRRAWAPDTAWGAIAILSGEKATWMGPTQRSRLAARLRTMSAPELAAALRNRATVTHYSAHPAAAARLRSLVVDTIAGARLLGLADTTTDIVDGYAAATDLDRLVRTHGLTADSSGNVTLRATDMDLTVVRELAHGAVLAAADLAGSSDPREAAAALRGLESALAAHRGH